MKPSLAVASRLGLVLLTPCAAAADGVFVRFQLLKPSDSAWFVKMGGFVHNDPWVLPDATWPAGASQDPAKRVAPGQSSPWFDLGAHAGNKLHGRLHRAGGVAEFPNITADFICQSSNTARQVIIELATAPEESAVVKRLEESFVGSRTSFLVSPTLRADADSLETAGQMTTRRLAWAREASGGKRVAPTNLWVQTQFWAPQRPELNVREAEVLWLLGFNLVGGARDEALAQYPFLEPGGHHWAEFGPGLTRQEIDQQIAGPAQSARSGPRPTLFGLSDEIACRPPIGDDTNALAHFRAWLKERAVAPADLGVTNLDEVLPIESPVALRERSEDQRRGSQSRICLDHAFPARTQPPSA